MKTFGEFKGIFYTNMFKDHVEATENLDVSLFAKARLHFTTCTGLSGELDLVDILNMVIYNLDDEE